MSSPKQSDIEKLNRITEKIIGAGIRVHQELGPGLLESAYQICLAHELQLAGLSFEQQKKLPLIYRGVEMNASYRIDILVEHAVVVELKTVETLLPVHDAQLISYLRLSGSKVGLLMNFHTNRLVNGLRRLVHRL